MSLYAFLGGITPLDESQMNAMLAMQDFELIYTGTSFDAKSGSGVAEFDCASYHHCIRFTATAVTEIARVVLNVAKDGTGADLTIELRSGMVPGSGTDGTLLATYVYPKEWLPDTAATFSFPLPMTGLTAGTTYFLVIKKAGDGTNHFHLIGETSTDTNHPCWYRAGSSGAWTAENAIQFSVYQGATGNILGVTAGMAVAAMEYNASNLITTIYSYLPNSEGSTGGIREKMTLTWSGSALIRGVTS